MTSSEASGPRIVTLTTDFGTRDPFVGQMKGAILSINPRATLVDITHDVQPHNVEEGAFVIGSSYPYFPEGTMHVVVVDPGVGSGRRPLLIEASGHWFVGPDNGLFTHVLRRSRTSRALHLTEERFFLSPKSPTFQGRDLFAPVAAWLSKGVGAESFGPQVSDPVRFPVPEPVVQGRVIRGEIIYVDRFGNAFTNIMSELLARAGGGFTAEVRGRETAPVKCYDEGSYGILSCLVNSSGHLEFFVRQGNAAGLFGLARGDAVAVIMADG